MRQVIPSTDFDLQKPLYEGFESIEIKEGWTNGRTLLPYPHRHSFHEVVFLNEGSEIHMVDYSEYVLEGKAVLFIPKGSVHEYRPKEHSTGWKLIFDLNFFRSFQASILDQYLIFIPGLQKKLITLKSDQFDLVLSTNKLLQSTKNHLQKQLLLSNILTLLEDCYKVSHKPTDEIFIRFQKLLSTKIHEEHYCAYYAQELTISERKLNHVISSATGVGTNRYIRARLLLEAKSNLTKPGVNVQQVAYNLGFYDPQYFSRIFKKRFGISPSNFQKSMTEISML